MPRMNSTDPEGQGPKTGRGLGKCKKNSSKEEINKLGTGMGMRRRSAGGTGKGNGLRSGS